MIRLPIDDHLPAIVAALRARPSLVITAEPGAGKTTRVPRALLDAGFASNPATGRAQTHGEILVLQPRRLASRMAAQRVADELGEPLGKTVGYQVRFDRVDSAQTKVRFVTEGIVSRRLMSDPNLSDVTCIVLDEFHERHIQADVTLALCRKLQRTRRPDLKIVVMSATLDAEAVATFLGCDSMHVPGRVFEVSVEYLPAPSDKPLEAKVAGAVRTLTAEGTQDDILVFLPGAAEIRRAQQACEALAKERDLEIAVLHGDLPAKEQDRAVSRGPKRKVILSTNIAETSLTIEGVGAVIDSGLARVASHSPWTGLPSLVTTLISRASAKQRAGRAGRVRAGRCIRLYTKHEHDTRPLQDTPELLRADLAELRLQLGLMADPPATEDWIAPPPPAALKAATELLQRLHALDATETLTELGGELAAFPLHPRVSRLLLAARRLGVAQSGATLCALISERDVVMRSRDRGRDGGRERGRRDDEVERSDLLSRLELFEGLEDAGFDRHRASSNEVDVGALKNVARVRDRLLRAGTSVATDENFDRETALLQSILLAFPDRVARRRSATSSEVVFVGGGSAKLDPSSVVKQAELMVVTEVTERSAGAGGSVLVRQASEIEPEWLLELLPERIVERTHTTFNDTTERVEQSLLLAYDDLVLDESKRRDLDPVSAAKTLFEAAAKRGPQAFGDVDEVTQFASRVAFARRKDPSLPDLGEQPAVLALERACEGAFTFADLKTRGLLGPLHSVLSSAQLARVEQLVPERVLLPGGRRVVVHYEASQPPWIESRLQDFFGMRDGPKLGGEPLVIHFLAPNMRALQVTTDLAGFWTRHYPDLRKQLMRRYPRHSWPEDPVTAKPPEPKAKR